MSRERMPDGSTVERDAHGQIVAVHVDGDTWARWEAERRRSFAKDRASRPADLAALAAKLAEAGLRPIVDEELGLVRAACPACHASDGDGIWRCRAIAPRRGKLLIACDACRLAEVEHG